jgi:hypothetical protein
MQNFIFELDNMPLSLISEREGWWGGSTINFFFGFVFKGDGPFSKCIIFTLYWQNVVTKRRASNPLSNRQ